MASRLSVFLAPEHRHRRNSQDGPTAFRKFLSCLCILFYFIVFIVCLSVGLLNNAIGYVTQRTASLSFLQDIFSHCKRRYGKFKSAYGERVKIFWKDAFFSAFGAIPSELSAMRKTALRQREAWFYFARLIVTLLRAKTPFIN